MSENSEKNAHHKFMEQKTDLYKRLLNYIFSPAHGVPQGMAVSQ